MDQLNFAVQVLVIGFAVVLATLFMLYGVLILFSRLFYGEGKKAAVDQQEPLSNKNSFEIAEDGVDGKVIAVITAAISEYMRQGENFKQIASVSILHNEAESPAVDSWKIIGRKALMENRAVLEKIRRNKRVEKI